jgi:hypothetical protein
VRSGCFYLKYNVRYNSFIIHRLAWKVNEY